MGDPLGPWHRRVSVSLASGSNDWNDESLRPTGNYEDWAVDAGTLNELAQELLPQTPTVRVRVSRTLADRAIAAWQRDEEWANVPEETEAQGSSRQAAAILALIGEHLEETGIEDGDEVVFELDAWLLGNALDTADRAGRLDIFPPRSR